ncbi:MAG: hypothetical protein A2958_00725 [Candidatus Levybacteria bacterium RIFCSPLOWO2_01_FULL_38_13]|nr:MAG: hypothetical protein A2629_00620 [Candidatus Levybacteria bacterium RIFCSPHIGHO2_01_FULL_41_15]OGH34811.1 MAG: hypothetical protein A2958_00725 [Candidatus Levybacteria bacterium RIFCSPLOWO2_01_FULL_38_13]
MSNGNNNRFFEGFLWGAIIGGGLVFFLTTKKGKKLLKTISENGLENLTEMLADDDLEYEETIEEIPEEPRIAQKETSSNGNGVPKSNSENEPVKTKPARRFFKRKTT